MVKDLFFTAGVILSVGIAFAFFLSRMFVLVGQWAELLFKILLGAFVITLAGLIIYVVANMIIEIIRLIYYSKREKLFYPREEGEPPKNKKKASQKYSALVSKGMERRSLRLAEQKIHL